MTIDLIALNGSAHTLTVSVMGSESSLQMIMNRCYATQERVRSSARRKKHTTATDTKSSKRISTAFLTCTTILSAPSDPDSTSRRFDREGGSYDLLMVPFTSMSVPELLEPRRPARTMASVAASACIGFREYYRPSIIQHLGDGRERTPI